MNPSNSLTDQIRSGSAPSNLREFAAQGLLPMSQDELLPLQVFLLSDPEPRIADLALATLRQVEDTVWARIVEKKDPDFSILKYILKFKPEALDIKEKILLNPSVPDELFRLMATSEAGKVVEIILNNHVRLLRDPQILTNLENNPALTFDQRRRIEEFKTEFIYKKQKLTQSTEIPLMALEDLLARVPNLDLESQKILEEIELNPGEHPSDEQVQQAMSDMFSREEIDEMPGEIVSTYQRILKMNHGEKVRVALLGDKEERTFLIRDKSRQVASLVLKNPKLTEGEMDAYAQMRNIDSDLLRQMGQSREFVKRYPVVHALSRNPKTPSPTALNLLKLLRETDLRNLERDRNIPEVIRRQAKKIREHKEQKKS